MDRDEALDRARRNSDGARIPSGSKTMWRFLNWVYAKTGHDANPQSYIEREEYDDDKWTLHRARIEETNKSMRERDEPAPSYNDLDYLSRGHVDDVQDAAEGESEKE